MEIVALEVDGSGSLSVSGTVDLASGADIDTVTTLGTITNDVKVVNGTTDLIVGLASGTDIDTVTTVTTLSTITNDVKVVNGTTGFTVSLAAGTNVIGQVQNDLVFTNVDSFGGATPLDPKTIPATTDVDATAQDISKQSSYNWYIKNTGAATCTYKVQISPDNSNWIDDTGTIYTLIASDSQMITVTHFLKYARFKVTGGASGTTVISCFQAQH